MMHLNQTIRKLKRENKRLKEEIVEYEQLYGPLQMCVYLDDDDESNIEVPHSGKRKTRPNDESNKNDLDKILDEGPYSVAVSLHSPFQSIRTAGPGLKIQLDSVTNSESLPNVKPSQQASKLIHDFNLKSKGFPELHWRNLMQNNRRASNPSHKKLRTSKGLQTRGSNVIPIISLHASLTPATDLLSEIAAFSCGSQSSHDVYSVALYEPFQNNNHSVSTATDNVSVCNIASSEVSANSDAPPIQNGCRRSNS